MIRKLGICLIVPFVFGTHLTGQVIKPYLQSPSDTSVWITWKTGANADSKVLFGSDSNALQNQVTGSCQVMTDTGYSNNYFYHSVRLTGLEPNRYYYYRAVTGSLQSAALRFRTQPMPGKHAGIYRVLILGDHQIKGNDHYEKLMKAAREKVLEKYGGSVEEHINLIINDGDQVDQGTLDQYEYVHFGPSAVLSGNVPIMTTVGNHEFYGSLGIAAYYKHYFYDDLGYKGITSPGGENYYSCQQGSIVFVHLSSEDPDDDQVRWVQQIVDSVKSDPSVAWLVSISHRPIQAEQYVGDISEYVRNQILPVLVQTEKSTLLISGHHHLYARGQVRDYPMYHIISGAASWDQYWGQSTEKDFDDVQKTIDYWAYQIATFDDASGKMTVESYAIGSPRLGLTLNNELIDSFYRKPGEAPPLKPSIITTPSDSVSLPFAFMSSPFSSGTSEPMNSTQFQISPDAGFSNCTIDLIRDFENLYGTTGSPDYRPVDINKSVNILEFKIERNKLPNGAYFIRTRQRDRNIEWSAWSDPVRFMVKGSVPGFTSISSGKEVYQAGEDILIDYRSGPGNARDWIGIYKKGQTPGSIPSTDWKYTSGSSGTLSLHVAEPGKYFVAFFENDGYDELCERIYLYVSNIPVLSLNKAGYAVGEEIQVSYSNAPAFPLDWIGIYNLGDTPGIIGSTRWDYTSGSSGMITFSGLPAGYYFVCYLLEDLYTEAGERTVFSVGTDLATLSADQPVYTSGRPVKIIFSNGPGTAKDWIGLFRQNAPPGTVPLVDRQFIPDQKSGSLSFDLVLDPGEYYAALFINNSSVRISNRATFTVESGSFSPDPEPPTDDPVLIPSPTTGRFRVKSSALQKDGFYVKIVSQAGAVLLEKQMKPGFSIYSGEIDLSGAPAGIYMVSLRAGNRVYNKRLIIE